MSADRKPRRAKADKAIRQFQAGNGVLLSPPPRLPASQEGMAIADIDAVSLAMRQFYQSPANSGG